MSRQNFKWSINETLKLQREYELLLLDVPQISKIHKRTQFAIVCKLYQEKFITNIKDARGFIYVKREVTYDSAEDDCSEYIPSESEYESESEYDSESESEYESESDYHKTDNRIFHDITQSDDEPVYLNIKTEPEPETTNVNQRVEKLENSVSNMEGMMTRLCNYITTNSSSLDMGYN